MESQHDRFYNFVVTTGQYVGYAVTLLTPIWVPLMDGITRGASAFTAVGTAILIGLKLRNVWRRPE